MPGGNARVEPIPAEYPPSASDEVSHLELHLQQQLQEDIARIFDESIYSDIEVVCGKLKILTHSCILKTRTNNFYRSLETILHLNIERSTFEEIYSFISDIYTECNIKQEENEIITYLNKIVNKIEPIRSSTWKSKEEIDDQDVFLTPKCVSPYGDKSLKSPTSSPRTELTKEYYSIVPIDGGGNILDKELKEQDLLFNAFHSIIKSQAPDHCKSPKSAKPTTLYLNINKNKIIKNATSCDSLNIYGLSDISKQEDNKKSSETNNQEAKEFANTEYCNKVPDSAYSPDSLIADDPSSSSDYLSAAYACSPGVSSSGCVFQLNAIDSITKMENIFTSSDSGLENTGLLESITSHKDITLADLSLNESTLHDLTTDDASNSHDSMSSPPEKPKITSDSVPLPVAVNTDESNFNCPNSNPVHRFKDSKSSKEEKQRQNEEIVIMESSSLSSETGSWESVFPPKLNEKDMCEKFINHEREFINQNASIEINTTKKSNESSGPSKQNEFKESFSSTLVHKSPFKSTSCFIDATLLIDDEDKIINIHVNENSEVGTVTAPSQPVPISSNKPDLSPTDWSESHDNDDSLEQTDNKDINHKDISPTIFEMTPVTEDSLFSDVFATVQVNSKPENDNLPQSLVETDFFPLPDTPHNSLRVLTPKSNDYSENCATPDISDTLKNECINIKNVKQSHEMSPIVSGGASIQDHLPQVNTYSPLTRKKLENVPIVSGAYTPNFDRSQSESPKPSNSAAWVIDVSNNKSSELEKQKDGPYKKVNDKASSINTENCNESRTSIDSDGNEKSSHKFYIDFSNIPTYTPVKPNIENSIEKKYIFSMFIDLGDKEGVTEMPARISTSVNNKRSIPNETKNTLKSGNRLKGKNEMSETEANVSGGPQINRNDSHDSKENECLTEDPNMIVKEIISLPRTVLVNLNKNTAHVLEKSNINDVVGCSQTSNIVESKNKEETNRENATRSPTSVSKYSVQSTECSSGQHFSTNIKNDREEQNNCNEASISGLSYDVHSRYSTASTICEESIADVDTKNDMESGDNEFFYVDKPSDSEPFVKLSDLDKPLSKPYSNKGKKGKAVDMRMTRSIPENNWCGQNAPISLDVISSFHSENALSLNRLFPHLQNEISRSMPGSLSSRTRSPMRAGTASSTGEGEDQVSDVSELSSMQSSACRSVVGNSTPEDTGQTSNIINQCQSRLGQDLLRMFLEEIAPDVIVEVSGRRIKAHKCILSSRCQYFAGILSGGWVESAGNVIPLPPFAYNVVHFAMCHIYSGTSAIPESVSIVELATLADMLGLEGLKEAIMFSLKSKYCHHFHKPCNVCIAGVLECFPLSSLCGLDDLYHKCLRWITKYFPKVWPTRAFATLPADLLERCFQQHVVNMTVENVADTVFGCGLAMMSLQSNIRGVDNVDTMCRRLMTASAQFAAPRLLAVLRAMEPVPLDAPPAALRALDDFVQAAIYRAPVEQVCRAYAYLENIVREIQIQQLSKPNLISNGYQNNIFTGDESYVHARANVWKLKCQYLLVDDALRVVNTQAFRDLPAGLQQKLRKLGCNPSLSIQPRRTTNLRNSRPTQSLNAHHADIEQMRASFVPYMPRPASSISAQEGLRSNVELRDERNKANRVPKVKTTKAQEKRTKFNMAKNAQSQSQTSTKPTRMFENAKPRYLEPKVVKQPEKKMAAQGKLMPKMMSSSESSRNSSPIQARGARARARAAGARASAMSQDSLATSSRPRTAEPSTDSLSESQTSNKYATFTKVKHTKANESALQQSSSVSSRSQQSVYNKARTKIPVSLTMSKSKPMNTSSNNDTSKRSSSGAGVTSASQSAHSKTERKVPGSLMNATKSSSAKVVQRIFTKEKTPKSTNKQSKASGSRQTNDPIPDIPAMGRSGTFLKDEPTFENNLDINK